MPQLTFFDEDRPTQALRLAPRLRALADRGIYFGTSSWKYEGWVGTIYSEGRYTHRGRFSQRKFEAECLTEYAKVFPVVCGDFSFYQFPNPDFWGQLFGESPSSLQFAFKVPEAITVAMWPAHARYGVRANRANPSFLDAQLFNQDFAHPLSPYTDRVAVLIFEFGTLAKTILSRLDFMARLDSFLADLPSGFRFAVEVRNPEYLGQDYFEVLTRHGVSHVFNAWTRMPDLTLQAELPGVFNANFTVVRALLRSGRSYEEAVSRFKPYRMIQESDSTTRTGIRQIVDRSNREGKPAFVFVNNRLEGHAPSTIEGVIETLEQ